MRMWQRFVALALVLVGAAISAYPVLLQIANDAKTVQSARKYVSVMSKSEDRQNVVALAAARAYNKTLNPGLLADPWGKETPDSGTEYSRYDNLLADSKVMATVTIPRIGVMLPVVHGTDDAALLSGVGHFYGSHLPVGGSGTHAVLAGHHSWPGHTYFSDLEQLKQGDQFLITVYGERLRYRVVDTQLVFPNDLSKIQPEKGRDLVTLVTCITPEGGYLNQYRLLVTGERAPDVGAQELQGRIADIATFRVQTWMWPRLAIAGCGVFFAAVIVVTWVKSGLRKKEQTGR
ncbi:class C sortase [Arcanobacterium canis]